MSATQQTALEQARIQFSENVAAIDKIIRSKDARIHELEGRLDEAQIRNGHLTDRIQQLEVVCERLVNLVNDTTDNTDGRYPGPEPSCNECTGGLTPIDRDKGLCAVHAAKKLLRKR